AAEVRTAETRLFRCVGTGAKNDGMVTSTRAATSGESIVAQASHPVRGEIANRSGAATARHVSSE
ncbi:MAG: hypothetical protein ABSF17_07315, partial [Terracidiphilus sp.]